MRQRPSRDRAHGSRPVRPFASRSSSQCKKGKRDEHPYRAIPLDDLGAYLGPFGLRLLLAWEFWESGVEKFTGANWFAEIQMRFPFPFDLIPAGVSWQLATWTELLGAIALVISLGIRFANVALVIVTVVAWSSVHAGLGYNVCHNGYKLALTHGLPAGNPRRHLPV